MNRIIAAVLALAVSVVVHSAEVYWTAPTSRVDGSSLTVEELDSYELCVSNSSELGCASPVTLPADVTSVPLNNLVNDHQVHYFTVRVIDTDGRQSAWSKPVSGKLVGPPHAPRIQLR